MAKQATLDWLLKFVTEHPGCKASDVPKNYRQFATLEREGKIEYRGDEFGTTPGGWHTKEQHENLAGS